MMYMITFSLGLFLLVALSLCFFAGEFSFLGYYLFPCQPE